MCVIDTPKSSGQVILINATGDDDNLLYNICIHVHVVTTCIYMSIEYTPSITMCLQYNV